MSIAASLASPSDSGWLRSVRFDLNFILGTTAIALASGWAVHMDPALLTPILILDIWLLGQHHVVSTFTRMCFSKDDLAKHRFLVFQLPFVIVAGVLAAGFGFGWWILGSTYFYWQWFHYTRQSWGISQFYRRKAGGRADENEWATKLAFYLPPLWGILHRSWQAPTEFLGLHFKVLPVSGTVVEIVGFAAIAAVSWWLVMRIIAWHRGEFALAHMLYMATHHIVFFTGYLLLEDVTQGWLVINIWHNAQYILFVWLQNNNRFKDGIDPAARSLSTLCQSDKVIRYFAVCLGISTLLYIGIKVSSVAIGDVGLPLLIVIYQIINFHHYVVDAVIWRSKKKNTVPGAAAGARGG